MRLVTEQPRTPLGNLPSQRLTGDVHQLRRLHPGGTTQRSEDRIPGEHLIPGDRVRLTQRRWLRQQPSEHVGEVGRMSQRPQAGAIPMDDGRLARPHPGDLGPVAVDRQRELVVGVRRTHDRHREAVLAIALHQEVLARDLVPRVLPERVAQRRRLPDRQARHRLGIGRRRRDEDVLPHPPREQLDIALQPIEGEAHEVGHHIERPSGQCRNNAGRIVQISVDDLHPIGHRTQIVPSPVQHRDPIPEPDRLPNARRTDDPGATNEQNSRFHERLRIDMSAAHSTPSRAGHSD